MLFFRITYRGSNLLLSTISIVRNRKLRTGHHYRFSSTEHARLVESGVVLPLVAVMLIVLIVTLVTLGSDTGRVHRAKNEASLLVDEVARLSAKELPNTSRAIQVFNDRMSTFWSSPSSFVKNGLTNSFPLASIRIGFAPNDIDITKNYPVSLNSLINLTNPGSGFTNSQWNFNAQFDGSTPGNVATEYPAGFLTQTQDTSSTLTIDLQIGIKTAMLDGLDSGKPLRVRSVYRRVPRVGSGFIVAIAPQFATDSSLARFRFDPSFSEFDPVQGVSSPFPGGFAVSDPSVSVFTGLSGAEQEQNLISCSNPASTVRNFALSAVLGRLVRSSFSRSNMSIWKVSSLSIAGGSFDPVPNSAIAPLAIIGSGSDTAAGFGVFPSSAITINGTEVSEASQDWSGSSNEGQKRFVRQLSNCYHLYTHDPSGISAATDLSHIDLLEDPALTPWQNPPPTYDGTSKLWGLSAAPRVQEIIEMIGAEQANPSGKNFEGGIAPGKEFLLNSQSSFDSTDPIVRPDYFGLLAALNAQADPLPRNLVIFSHQAPLASEVANISSLVTQLNARGVWITVIYIPVTNLATSDESIMSSAFVESSPDGQNMIFRIRPATAAIAGGAIDTNWRNFWHCLLDPNFLGSGGCDALFISGSARSIVEIARDEIFDGRLTEVRLAF